MATPFSFETRSRRPAASRTCETDPGAEPISRDQSVWTESITQTPGRSRSRVVADGVELRLCEDLDAAAAAETCRAQLHLRHRLLARDEERATLGRDRAERVQEQGRLADPGLAADEHDRRRDEPAAEHTVELGNPRGDALRLLGDDVDEPQRRACRSVLCAAPRQGLGEQRPELPAAGAAPEPAAGRRAALGAHMLDGGGLRSHGQLTVLAGPDGNRAASETIDPQRSPGRSCVRFAWMARRSPVAVEGHRALPCAAGRAGGRPRPACPRREPTLRSSMPSGRARRSARSSGRSSSPSSPPTTGPSTPTGRLGRPGQRDLRAAEDIELERDSARLWHWRARTTELQTAGGPELPARYATFDQLIAATAMRGYEQGILPSPLRGDFRAYGKVYRHLTPEQHAEAYSIAVERHHALNWLCGGRHDLGRRPARHVISTSLSSVSVADRLAAYAELIVRVGANVQPGQQVFVVGLVEHAPLVRAVTRGRLRRRRAPTSTCATPISTCARRSSSMRPRRTSDRRSPGSCARTEALARRRRGDQLAGEPEPELLADVDQGRIGRARAVEGMQIYLRALNERTINWTIAAFPTEGQARQCSASPTSTASGTRSPHAVRLDEPDPVEAWRGHCESSRARCRQLDARAFDAIRFTGPGTDLTVGLHPGRSLVGGGVETRAGSTTWRTCPRRRSSPARTGGGRRAACARPARSRSAARSSATSRCASRRASASTSPRRPAPTPCAGSSQSTTSAAGSARSRSSTASRASARRGSRFFDTLFDENATCHIAYGSAVTFGIDGLDGLSPDELRERGINVSVGAHRLHDRRPRGGGGRHDRRTDRLCRSCERTHGSCRRTASPLCRARRARRRERAGGPDGLRHSPRSSTHRSPARSRGRPTKRGRALRRRPYRDQHVRKAMIELGPDEALTHEPGWMKTLAESNAGHAQIATTGDPSPTAVRPRRRTSRPGADEGDRGDLPPAAGRPSVNWTIVAYPNDGWAEKVFGEPDSSASGRRSRLHTTRRARPRRSVARAHGSGSRARSAAQRARARLPPLPGARARTSVGLLPNARWMSALFRTRDGIDYVPNMPTEEVFTTPDCRRAEGTVRSSRPLALNGEVIEGLQLTVSRREDHRRGSRPRRRNRPRPARERRTRALLRRAGARRRHLARRPDRDHLLRHALRRERDLPHRLRLRHPGGLRRRARARE